MGSETRNQWAGAHDLWLEVFLIFNFACLTADILLAHSENSFRNHAEYIPLWFSGLAAIALIVGLASRFKSESLALWKWIGLGVAWISIVVGVAGVGFHLESGFF